MARPMKASPRLPSPSRAPNGMAHVSLACGTRKIDRQWRPGHEGSFRKAGPPIGGLADRCLLSGLKQKFFWNVSNIVHRIREPEDHACSFTVPHIGTCQ